jgi:two-component system, cell cycle response regulator
MLKILVVTEDRALTRSLSHFFDSVGYQVLQAASAETALAAVDADPPCILLLDVDPASQANWQLCRTLAERQFENASFTFLMVDDLDEARLKEAFAAGVDDVLIKPINHGELVARLRAAARVLEHDRRAAQQRHADTLTGLAARAEALAQLRRQWLHSTSGPPRSSCVVVDVDYFRRIERTRGACAAAELLRSVAHELAQLAGDDVCVARLDRDRFCVVLSDTGPNAAAEWAEKARQTIAGRPFELPNGTVRITVSCGVAGADAAGGPENLLDLALDALAMAKASGRDCVVRQGEHSPEIGQPVAYEQLFERTVARDVMTPCSVYLQAGEPLAEAVELLRRTQLEEVPVVDAEGRLLGVCEQSTAARVPEAEHATRKVRDCMTTDVQTFGEYEKLTGLLDFFTRDRRLSTVIVQDGRPVGFVTCDTLVALSRPVRPSRLEADAIYSDKSAYLLVGDLRPTEIK